MDEANFSEILELKIDVPGFKAALEEVSAVYQQWLSDLGAADAGAVLGIGNIDALKADIQGVLETITEVNAEILSNSQATQAAVQSLIEDTDAADEAAAARQRQRVDDNAAAAIEAQEKIRAAQENLGGSDTSLLSPKADPVSADIIAEQQGIRDQYAAWWEQALAKRDAQEEDSRMTRVRAGEEIDAIHERALAENEAFDQKRALQEEDIQMTRVRSGEEMEAVHSRALAENEAFDQKLAKQQESMNMTRVRAGEEIDAIHERALAENEAFDKRQGGEGFTNLITPQEIVRIGQYVILWKAISTILEGIAKAIAAPFEAVKSGITYMEQLEAKADELTGVLDANVKFSADLAENFSRAADTAPEIVKALQDAAIASHTNPDQLENIFKALANNGAVAGVQNMRQLVDLATMYGTALKASGASAQSVQRAVMEIPKAMEGTLPPTSKWLQVLGLTNDQWITLRDQGLKYHDLVERIGNLPSMQAHLAAIDKMKTGYESAKESLELLINRLEAAGAEPLFDAVKSWIKELNDWITTNESKLAESLRSFASNVEELSKVSAGPILTIAVGLIEIFADVLKYVEYIIIGVDSLGKHLALLFSGDFSVEAWQKIGDAADAAFDRISGRTNDLKKDLESLSSTVVPSVEKAGNAPVTSLVSQLTHNTQWTPPTPSKPVNPNDVPDWDKSGGNRNLSGSVNSRQADARSIIDAVSNSSAVKLDAHVTNKTPAPPAPAPPAADAKKEFDASKADWQQYAEDLKIYYKQIENDLSESVAAQKTSRAAAAAIVKKDADEEIKALQMLAGTASLEAKAKQAEIDNLPGVTAKERDAKQSALTALQTDLKSYLRQNEALQQTARDRASAAAKAAAVEAVQIQQEGFKQQLAVKEESLKRQVASTKSQEQGGYLTPTQAFDQETSLLARQRAVRQEQDSLELSQYGTGTVKYAELTRKRAQAEIDFTSEVSLRAQQRMLVAQREFDAKQRLADEARQIDLANREQELSIESKASSGGRDKSGDEEMFNARSRELETLIQQKEASLEAAQARNSESEATKKLANELQALYGQRLRLAGGRIDQQTKLVPDSTMAPTLAAPVIRRELDAAQQDEGHAHRKLDEFNDANPEADNAQLQDPKVEAERNALASSYEKAAAEVTRLTQVLQNAEPTWDQALSGFAAKLLGFDPFTAWQSAKKKDQDSGGGLTGYDAEIGAGAKDVAAAFKGVVNAAQTYEEGYKQGGILGGAGSLVSQFGSLLPGVAGQIASAVGSIMSTIGGLFTQAARSIAEHIQTEITNTMQLYSTQEADLVNTIQALQQEENQAISQLSGKKGGQDQLNKLLPSLQQQIASLTQQANQTLGSFQFMTENLLDQNNALSQINQEWEQINQQVADYLSAGGNATTAAEALSGTLQKIQTDTQNSLNQANDQAVQDAITLNGLLQQKLQLTEQYNQQVFAVTNQGSIQIQAGAVTQGQQLEQLAAQYAQQSLDLETQITLTQQKVAAEGQLFDLAQNINDLHAQDAQLQMDALDYQLQQYKAMQQIVAGITKDQSGLYTAAPGLFNALPTTIIVELQLAGYTLTATGTLSPGSNTPTGYGSSGDLSDQIQQQLRQTLSP